MATLQPRYYLPIATLYIYCRDTLSSFIKKYSEAHEGFPDSSDVEKCRDQLGRLREWDEDLKASVGELDHVLRYNHEVKGKVVELLVQLVQKLEDAKTAAINSVPAADYIHVVEEPESDTSSQSFIAEQLVEIRSLILDLQRLTEALDRSAFMKGSPQTDEKHATQDIMHVKERFGKADEELKYTLGIALSNRRQLLMTSTGKAKVVESKGRHHVEFAENSAGKHDDDLDTADRTSLTSNVVHTAGLRSSTKPQSQGKSTLPTSVTDNEVERRSVDEYQFHLPLSGEDLVSGKPFECPFCLKLLHNITNLRVWRHHVMTDLEPYLCTYGKCLSPGKTYRTRDEWFNHEREEHLLPKYWECPRCDKHSDKEEAFRSHLDKNHPKAFSPEEIDFMVKICEKHREQPLLKRKCQLCCKMCETGEVLKNHVALELEQLALFSLQAGTQFTVKDEQVELSEDDWKELKQIYDLGIIKDLAEKDNGKEQVLQIIKRQEEDPSLLLTQPPTIRLEDEKGTIAMLREVAGTFSRKAGCEFPISTIKHARDTDFFQRPTVWNLKDMHDTLSNLDRRVAIIYGQGGVGKTLLALEYAYEFEKEYDAIFWLYAESEITLYSSMSEVAEKLELGLDGSEDEQEIVNIVIEWMRDADNKWLAIVDNLKEWDVIRKTLPANICGRNGNIIITAQNSQLAYNVPIKIPLPLLSKEEGGLMLLHYFRDMPEEDIPENGLAEDIAALVGGLPVSIGLAAKHISSVRRPIREAEDLREMFQSVLEEAHTTRSVDAEDAEEDAEGQKIDLNRGTLSYDETIQVVCDFFQKELPRHSRDLVNLLAFFHPDAIQQKMLWTVHENPNLKFLNPAAVHLKQKRTNKALLASRFVTEIEKDGEACYTIHRELQRSLRKSLQDENRLQTLFNQAVEILRLALPDSSPIQVPEESKWAEHKILLPHVSALREIYLHQFEQMRGVIKGSKMFVQILSDAGMNQWEQGVNREGLDNVLAADFILEKDLKDSSSPLKADVDVLIGMTMEKGIAEREEALNRRRNVLKLRQGFAALKSSLDQYEEIKLYNAHSDLAFSLLEYNDYIQAEKLFEICRQKYRQWADERTDDISYEWAKYYNSKAQICMLQGKYEDAAIAAQEAMSLNAQLGNRNGFLMWKFLLASIYLQQGEIHQALKTHREVWEERKTKGGAFNEQTLESCYAVGAIYEQLGRYDEAEKHFRESLKEFKTARWCEEAVARCRYHLGYVMIKRGKSEQDAKNLQSQAREVLHRLLPKDMPEWLEGEQNEEILFDHLRSYRARFTGTGLLKRFQKCFKPEQKLAPLSVKELIGV